MRRFVTSFRTASARRTSACFSLDVACTLGDTAGAPCRRSSFAAMLDRHSDAAFNKLQIWTVARRKQGDCHSFASCASGSTDPVNVAFQVVRDIVIVYVRYSFDINASGSYISGDEQLQLGVAKPLHDRLPFRLRQIAVQLVHLKAFSRKLFRQTLRADLGTAKQHRQIRLMLAYKPDQRVKLGAVGRFYGDLANFFHGHCFRFDANRNGLTHICSRKLANGRRNCCGEQHRLLRTRKLCEYGFDLLEKAHMEHLISLIQHQLLDVRQPDGASANVVKQPSRRCHNDVGAACQLAALRFNILAAVYGKHACSDYRSECLQLR